MKGSAGRNAAFTLLEILVVIIVIAILATLLIPVISSMKARAQRVQCMANLRSLYTATELYLQQNGSWPQIAMALESDTSEQDYAKAWMAALAPFGPTQKTWVCPTMQETAGKPDLGDAQNVRVDYIAMTFDDKPTTPHQWPRHPWFIEAGDVHGNGNLIIFTDGSVSDAKTIAAAASPPPSASP
jgi:prepilin-type N-terminal cleavage/methylation domain-containing protein